MTERWTMARWREHVTGLEGEPLWTQTVAANRMEFYQALRADGYTGAEIEIVLSYFAERFRQLGQEPPPGGLFSLRDLELQDRSR